MWFIIGCIVGCFIIAPVLVVAVVIVTHLRIIKLGKQAIRENCEYQPKPRPAAGDKGEGK